MEAQFEALDEHNIFYLDAQDFNTHITCLSKSIFHAEIYHKKRQLWDDLQQNGNEKREQEHTRQDRIEASHQHIFAKKLEDAKLLKSCGFTPR